MNDSGESVKNRSFGNLEESSSPEDDEAEGATWDSSLAVARKPQPSTRVSLLVEALVRSVVTAYETDGNRAANAYKKICYRLFQMGLIDESWSMVELEGARVQFEHALFQLLESGPVKSPSSPLLLQGEYYTSQYKREFEEYEKIGGGAFGKVFRVKHKLDGFDYAVKKIPINSDGIDSVKNYLSEVKTFASLNHPNIVQYKAAWLEIGAPPDVKAIVGPTWDQEKTSILIQEQFLFHKDISSSSLLHDDNNQSNFEVVFESSPNGSPNKSSSSSSKTMPNFDDTGSFYRGATVSSYTSKKTDSNSNLEIAFKHSGSGISNIIKESQSFSGSSSPRKNALVRKTSKTSETKRHKVRWATLYIQMALCHGTLDQWLRRRNESFNSDLALTSNNAQALRTKVIQEILIQILRGLKYIHSKGVVHHDIKPSNIFVSADGGSLLIQLGDFGLACPLQRTRHGFARGTPLYAAPEQLAGRCDPKSDLYSVGIVLYELLENFGTDMERTTRISQLRARNDPPISSDFRLGNLVSVLVRRRALERPDASILLEALEGGHNSPRKDLQVLQDILQEKDKEIERLKALLQKHGLNSS